MPFPTAAFAVFFLAAFTLNWLLRPHGLLWRATMVAVSLYFCAWVDVRFALADRRLGGGERACWPTAAARALDFGEPTPASRRWVAAAVVVDVAVLGLFAYHGFFLDSVTDVLGAVGLSATAPTLGLLVPVGLSIVTLQAISYVVDVGRGEVEPVAWGDLLLYLSFFPHLVAGPPVRVDELVPQFHERPDPRRVPATDGVRARRRRPVQGGRRRRLPRARAGRPGVRRPRRRQRLGPRRRPVRLRRADLRRVLGPDRHRRRLRAAARHRVPAPVRRALHAPCRCASSGTGGTRRCPTGCATTSTSRSAATGTARRPPTGTSSSPWSPGGLWYGAGWPFVVWGALHGAYLVGERAASARRRGATAASAARGAAGDAGGGRAAVGAHLPPRGRGLGLLPRRLGGHRASRCSAASSPSPLATSPWSPPWRSSSWWRPSPSSSCPPDLTLGLAGPLHHAGAGRAGGGAGARS